jgi:hypothetical protein
MSLTSSFPKLSAAISAFNAAGQVGPDPLAAVYAERRKQHSLFSNLLSDADLEALRPYCGLTSSATGETSASGPGTSPPVSPTSSLAPGAFQPRASWRCCRASPTDEFP